VLPPSDCSLGICTVSLGRFASAAPGGLGGPDTDEVDAVRCGGGGGKAVFCNDDRDACAGCGMSLVFSRDITATSID